MTNPTENKPDLGDTVWLTREKYTVTINPGIVYCDQHPEGLWQGTIKLATFSMDAFYDSELHCVACLPSKAHVLSNTELKDYDLMRNITSKVTGEYSI